MKNSFNNKYTLLILVLTSFLFSEMKIGYLNVDKILSELDEVRQVYVELEKEQRKIEVEYQNLQFELDSLFRNYEQQKMLMSDERRKKQKLPFKINKLNLRDFKLKKLVHKEKYIVFRSN